MRNATILMIDDSAVNIDVVRSTLEPFGYSIVWTHDGRLALELARTTLPDLVLCDIHMPGPDGFAILTALKADSSLRCIPFVFLTATIWRGADRRLGMALGAQRFITRPIDPSVLLAEIDDCLRKAG